MATSHSVQFAGGNLSGQRHICTFFNSTDEEHRVLRSFIKDGFDRGDKAFHLVDDQLREEHLKRLAEAGIKWQETMDTLRTHPVVIIGGILQENPFFIPPDQFLLELQERRSIRKSAATAN